MANKLIEFSLLNRYIELTLTIGLLACGIYNIQRNPVDAVSGKICFITFRCPV
jgi:Cu/Ag efflux pump CusA